MKFKIGDKVKKPKGYSFDGIVVSIFETTKSDVRIVAELENNGMLHIFSESQLELRLKMFDIWSEGYDGIYGSSKAFKLTSIEATTFDEAMEIYIKIKFKDKALIPYRAEREQFVSDEAFKNRRTDWYFWGCALFDNEEDARQTFG